MVKVSLGWVLYVLSSSSVPSSNMNRRTNNLLHTHALYGDVCYDGIHVSSISLVHASTSDVVGPFGSIQDTVYAGVRNLARTSTMPRDVRPRPRFTSHSADPLLMGDHGKNKAGLEKLRREVYNPGAGYDSSDSRGKRKHEDGRRCAVCLDDFEPTQPVTLTPCHHMFHDKCIVPWVKSHGQCPVCRFVIVDRTKGSQTSNNSELENDPFARDFLSFIRAMEASRG